MSKGGKYLKTAPAKQKSGSKKKVVLIVLGIILVLLIAVGIAAAIYINSMMNLVRRPEKVEHELSQEEINAILGYDPLTETIEPEAEQTEATEPVETGPVSYGQTGKVVNVLVVGQSSREGEDSKLSDTIILCTINKETKVMTLTSFLRDAYVQLPSPYKGHTCGKQRINVAYALGYAWGGEAGAMEYMDLTIKNNFGAEVDYNVEIDFDAFEQIVDLMGGVKIELNEEEAKYMTKSFADLGIERNYKVGKSNNLSGWEALVYARMRHSSEADNDLKRTNRQRVVIGKLLEKARTLSPRKLNYIARKVLPLILTDMTNEQITSCMLEILPILPSLTMESNQCPAPDTFWGEVIEISGVESGVLKCDIEQNRRLLMAIAEADHQ